MHKQPPIFTSASAIALCISSLAFFSISHPWSHANGDAAIGDFFGSIALTMFSDLCAAALAGFALLRNERYWPLASALLLLAALPIAVPILHHLYVLSTT